MRKRGNLYALFSLLLAVVFIGTALPVGGVAQGGAEVIESFEVPVTELAVDAGTVVADIPLPETLAATLEGGGQRDIPVTWDDGGLYGKGTAGEYTFTADFDVSYTFADARPVAVVTVASPMLTAPSAIIPSDYVLDYTREFVVGGYDATPNVTDMKYVLYRQRGLPRAIVNGQLFYKTSNYSQNGGNYYANYAYPHDQYSSGHYSITVNGTCYKLIGGENYRLDYYRGYKYSEDRQTLSIAFHLGDTVGVAYLHFTIRPGSSVLEERWEYVSLGAGIQDIYVTHGNDIYYAGNDRSMIASKPGSPVATCFGNSSQPAMFMYVNEITTPVPAAADGYMMSLGGAPKALRYAYEEGALFYPGNAVTYTRDRVDSVMAIQWQHQVAPGGFATGSGGTSFGAPGGLQFKPGSATLVNPNKEDASKNINHTVLNLMGGTINIPASSWSFSNVPTGMTVTPPSLLSISGYEGAFNLTYAADLSVPPRTYEVLCKVTHNGEEYQFTDTITVTRDTQDITTSVVNETDSPITDALSNVEESTTAPVAGTTLYKYYDGKLAWTLDSANYEIKNIKVNGTPLSAAALAAAKADNYLAFPEMTEDKDVVIVVGEPAAVDVDLTITKTVAGKDGDKTKEFTLTVYFQDADGAALAEGTVFSYTGGIKPGSGAAAPSDGTLELDGEGKGVITLKHGQTITIAEVASDAKIRIVETAASGYTVSFKDSEKPNLINDADTGVCQMTENDRTFDFTNTRSSVTPTGVSTGGTGLVSLTLLTLLGVIAGFAAKRVYRRRRAR